MRHLDPKTEAEVLFNAACRVGLDIKRNGEKLEVRGPEKFAPIAKALLSHKKEVLALLDAGWGCGVEGA